MPINLVDYPALGIEFILEKKGRRRRGGKQREREERGICEGRARRGDSIREQANKLGKAQLDMN